MADKWTDQGWPVLTMTTQVENSIPRMQHSKFLLSETRVTDQCLEQQTNHSFIHFKHNYKLPTVAATVSFGIKAIMSLWNWQVPTAAVLTTPLSNFIAIGEHQIFCLRDFIRSDDKTSFVITKQLTVPYVQLVMISQQVVTLVIRVGKMEDDNCSYLLPSCHYQC